VFLIRRVTALIHEAARVRGGRTYSRESSRIKLATADVKEGTCPSEASWVRRDTTANPSDTPYDTRPMNGLE
jgi:hypothetical protein